MDPDRPEVGQRWVDVTAVGARPRMRTTVLIRPVQWTERGTWRGIDAELTLLFALRPDGCRVTAAVRVTGPGGAVLTRLAPYAIRNDLRRAARILSRRTTGQ